MGNSEKLWENEDEDEDDDDDDYDDDDDDEDDDDDDDEDERINQWMGSLSLYLSLSLLEGPLTSPAPTFFDMAQKRRMVAMGMSRRMNPSTSKLLNGKEFQCQGHKREAQLQA